VLKPHRGGEPEGELDADLTCFLCQDCAASLTALPFESRSIRTTLCHYLIDKQIEVTQAGIPNAPTPWIPRIILGHVSGASKGDRPRG
jgi:hypothetical protein